MPCLLLSEVGSQVVMLDDTPVEKSNIAGRIERDLCVSLPFEFSRICQFLDGSGLATTSLTGAGDEAEGNG